METVFSNLVKQRSHPEELTFQIQQKIRKEKVKEKGRKFE